MVPFLVSVFDKSTLSNLVKECFGSDFPDILLKKQIGYIYRYLKDLNAESILLEFDYLDRDYLEDYSRYYVKRFNANGSKCARLHFFSTKVQHSMIDEALTQADSSGAREELQKNYLGYAVIKPLPKTFIGRTCLRTYHDMELSDGSKNLVSRDYDVDLFGIKLSVSSIAFQEQDKVVSACATTAIWAALQGIMWKQVRDIPACSEVTINAINHIDGSSNSFPSRELSNKQILRALDVEDLRNHHLPLNDISQERFLQIVKYHIDSGLPLILGAEVYAVVNGKELNLLAGHAVTVLGYKNAQTRAVYIHDDRLGPYARAQFIDLAEFDKAPESLKRLWGLVLQEKDEKGAWQLPHEVLIPKSLVMPAHKKVRLPFSFAESTSDFIKSEYENWLEEEFSGASEQYAEVKGKLDYKLRLEEISAIRQRIIDFDFELVPENAGKLSALNKSKIDFLTKSYARFHWVAEFYYEGVEAFEVLFDATDIPQGDAVVGIFIKNAEKAEAVLTIFRKYAASANKIEQPESESFYVSFLKQLRVPEGTYEDYLDKNFGSLRAPQYLKPKEVASGDIVVNASRKRYYAAVHQSLEQEFPDVQLDEEKSYKLWAVAHDGSLLIGDEIGEVGHPGLTGFKPARIAGELRLTSSGWSLNAKSGRYSKDYPNSNELLENAAEKFRTIFYLSRGNIRSEFFVL